MSAVTTLPWGRELTRADLDAMPDDGHRYELLDGVLVVTPAPSLRHQRAVVRLIQILAPALPAGQEVLTAPFDVALATDTVLQPDLLIARIADLTEADLPAAPLLAIEVLSPSTRRFDLFTKRARYEAAGCEHYWVVDPQEPSITAWRLVDDAYAEVGRAVGEEALVVSAPVAVTITPNNLVD